MTVAMFVHFRFNQKLNTVVPAFFYALVTSSSEKYFCHWFSGILTLVYASRMVPFMFYQKIK
jgi:hypothetical protein